MCYYLNVHFQGQRVKRFQAFKVKSGYFDEVFHCQCRITHGMLTMLLRNMLHQSSEILIHIPLLTGSQKFSVHCLYYNLSLIITLSPCLYKSPKPRTTYFDPEDGSSKFLTIIGRIAYFQMESSPQNLTNSNKPP